MLKKLLIVCLLGTCGAVVAQEPLRFTEKQGLPTNHVYDIQEDANGFMWFATKEGIVKFDGETFKPFTIQNGLPNNDTWRLEIDYQGRLWYFSKSAYQGYIKNDSIYKFSTKDKKILVPPCYYKTEEDFSFESHGSNYKLEQNTFVTVNPNFQKRDSLVNSIAAKRGYDIKKHYFFFNPQTQEYFYVDYIKKVVLIFDLNYKYKWELPIKSFPEKISTTLVEYGLMYNEIAYYAFDSGVLFVNFKTNTCTYKTYKTLFGVDKTEYFRCKSLKNEFQLSIPGHLTVLDYQLKIKDQISFSKDLGRFSFKDSRNNVWLLSPSKGISLLSNTQLQSSYHLKGLNVQKLKWMNKKLYLGVFGKGFYSYNTESNRLRTVEGLNSPHSEIYHIKEDTVTNIKLFISAHKVFQLSNNKLELIKTRPVDAFNNSSGAKDIIVANEQYYYVSSVGVNTYKKQEGVFESYIKKNGLFAIETFNGNIYLGGTDGLYQIQKDSLVQPDVLKALKDISVISLSSSEKHLFVGTDGRGLYIKNKDTVFHLKETDGLSVKKIIIEQDTLWLATQKGVKKIVVNPKNISDSKLVDSFQTSDGLLQNNINDIDKINNLLYVASDTGLTVLNVADSLYKQQPKLYFKTKQDTIHYRHQSRDNIAIQFGLQDYVNKEYVTYQYRLLPNQKEWISTQTKTLNFSNLSPNYYQLEIKATDQHFNSSVEKLVLNVVPCWWQTTLAKIGFGLLFVICFLGILKLLQLRIQQKEAAKTQLNKKIAGLELQALRSQMNPHFIHNSLNAIQYYIQRNEVEESEDYLVKFSKLVRMFFEYSRQQNITIAEEKLLLENYLEIEKLRFEDKLSYQISVDEQIDVKKHVIPSMILQPIVENAVNHGIFHKKEKGNISVLFKYIDEETLRIIVEDDGIGVIKAKKIYKHSTKNYQSNSSLVLQERLKLLNQNNDWNIVYNIEDLSSSETSGTRVTITFNQLKV